MTIATALLPACLVNTELYEERREALLDADGDGVSVAQGDCDDANARVHPGAAELCNGFDDNCAGGVDEIDPGNDTLWGADGDTDGFASADGTTYAACVSPGAGWVSVFGDCDDTDAAVWPGAPEACDGVDNDCDDAADEEPTVDPPTWHPDADGDGFGIPDEGVSQCLPPATGWVTDGSDCADDDAERRPEALERCNGLDDDCDGNTDEAPVVDSESWYPDRDGDGYGDISSASCSPAEGFVETGGDCDDTSATVHPDGTEVCNDGVDGNCNGTADDCIWDSIVTLGEKRSIAPVLSGEEFGYAAAAGDLDGDGVPELVVTAPIAAADGTTLGAVRVFRTPVLDDLSTDDATVTLWGDHDLSGVGSSLVVHDVNGDGVDDVQVGAGVRTVDGMTWAGTLYTYLGPVLTGGSLDRLADWAVVGAAEEEYVGFRAYGFGDLDGDGLPNFGTGCEFASYGGVFESGVVYVFDSVGADREPAADAATAIIYGSDENDELGLAATGLDVDGDGLNDIAIGAQGFEYGSSDGAALVFLGPVRGSIAGDDADATYTAEGPVHYAGREVDTLGDINGDGLDDLLVGAPYASGGSAYIIWGSSSPEDRGLADADVTFRSDHSNSFLGYSVEGLGDLNDDGWPDLFLSEEVAYDDAAKAYVFFGPLDAPAVFHSSEAAVTLVGRISDAVYESAFTPGDATGDGVLDLVVSSHKYGVADTDGIVYVIPGTGL